MMSDTIGTSVPMTLADIPLMRNEGPLMVEVMMVDEGGLPSCPIPEQLLRESTTTTTTTMTTETRTGPPIFGKEDEEKQTIVAGKRQKKTPTIPAPCIVEQFISKLQKPFSDPDYEWERKEPMFASIQKLTIPMVGTTYDTFPIEKIMKSKEGRTWMRATLIAKFFLPEYHLMDDAIRSALNTHEDMQKQIQKQQRKKVTDQKKHNRDLATKERKRLRSEEKAQRDQDKQQKLLLKKKEQAIKKQEREKKKMIVLESKRIKQERKILKRAMKAAEEQKRKKRRKRRKKPISSSEDDSEKSSDEDDPRGFLYYHSQTH